MASQVVSDMLVLHCCYIFTYILLWIWVSQHGLGGLEIVWADFQMRSEGGRCLTEIRSKEENQGKLLGLTSQTR